MHKYNEHSNNNNSSSRNCRRADDANDKRDRRQQRLLSMAVEKPRNALNLSDELVVNALTFLGYMRLGGAVEVGKGSHATIIS